MIHRCAIFVVLLSSTRLLAEAPLTSLEAPRGTFAQSDRPYAVLERGPVRAVIVNNEGTAADDPVLPGHRPGYSGVGSLTHERRRENLFVPTYAGLNFEHIHDGRTNEREILFEPRHAPMELRRIAPDTVDLYQAPSPHYGLESCLRYRILEDGCLEMSLECVPRKEFHNSYFGLFWASYIQRPESLDIFFRGRPASGGPTDWIRGVTPRHGVHSTHRGVGDARSFEHDADFPLTLVFNESEHRYVEPWYYGVSHGMALALIFRPRDQVRLTQSPSGGGEGNPAWDFQCFFPAKPIGATHQLVMRALYLPFESAEQLREATRRHREALAK